MYFHINELQPGDVLLVQQCRASMSFLWVRTRIEDTLAALSGTDFPPVGENGAHF